MAMRNGAGLGGCHTSAHALHVDEQHERGDGDDRFVQSHEKPSSKNSICVPGGKCGLASGDEFRQQSRAVRQAADQDAFVSGMGALADSA